MRAFSLIVFALVLSVVTLTNSGCALFGPSVEKAQQIADEREAQAKQAADAFKAAEKELSEVLAKLDAAIKADDKTEIERLVLLAQSVNGKYEATKEAAKQAENLFTSAVQDFKDAKSASDYIGTIFGWLSVGLGALGIGGTAAGVISSKRRGEALGGVTTALEKVKAAPKPEDAWPSAKADMQANLSTAALKLVEKFRP